MRLPEVTFHIYPTDCDMLGHLNHATMLSFLERARWALLEPQINLRDWTRQPVYSVVRHVDIGYLAQSFRGIESSEPCTHDDDLLHALRVLTSRSASESPVGVVNVCS